MPDIWARPVVCAVLKFCFSYRGNLTSTTRWDESPAYSTDINHAVTSKVAYNIAGSPISQTDPMQRVTRIGYGDSWNDSATRYTYAYPTQLTDSAATALGEAGHTSTIKYRYDIGANVEATSPAPAGNTYGKTSTREFDAIGRLLKESVLVNGTPQYYTRYAFPNPDNGVQRMQYSTIVDTNNNGPDPSDEVLTESWTDGAGRVRQSRTPHTFNSNGTTATWAATTVDYDILGRVLRQSVPTEVNSSWAATGDDLARGFIYNYTFYDWKGRTKRTVPSDSDGNDGKDTLISYVGCGCAGNQVTTIQGPVTTAVDVVGNLQTTKRRTQKAYEDILGRTVKTEIWDLNGEGNTPYSTVKTWFNGRDQALSTKEFAGPDTSSTFLESKMVYDGHGRLYQSHKPEQRDSSNSPKYTTYSYNADDSISSVTDARGAVTNLTYNNQGLVRTKGWTVPSGSNIVDPVDVTFAYDNLGNRTQMTDALGRVDYTYDSLSRMTSELRDFDDSMPDSPIAGGKYQIDYTYSLSGQLKSYTDTFGKTITMTSDKTGRLTSVSGNTSYGTIAYAYSPHYRAWGALSHLEYGNGTVMNSGGFDNKLQPTTFEVHNSTISIINKTLDYYADGDVKSEFDSVDNRFDRLFVKDFALRLKTIKSGSVARGGTNHGYDTPFGNSFEYDAFGNRTQASNTLYELGPWTTTFSFSNGRNTSNPLFTYDAEGNQLWDGKTFSYDAAGHLSGSTFIEYDPPAQNTKSETFTYDGDDRLVKIGTLDVPEEGSPQANSTYQIRSSMLNGEIVCETSFSGWRSRTFIRAAGTVIATDMPYVGTYWMQKDPLLNTLRSTDSGGWVQGGGVNGGDTDKYELNSDGNPIPFESPNWGYPPDPEPDLYSQGNSIRTAFSINGIQVPATMFNNKVESGMVGGVFGLVEYSAMMSNRLVGVRSTGVSWGRHFTEEYNVNGSRNVWFGSYDKSLSNVSYSNTSAIYDTSWSTFSLFYWQTRQTNNAQPRKMEPLPSNADLRKRFVERLDMSNKKCRDFLDRVLKYLEIKHSIEELFDENAKKGGYVLADNLGGSKGRTPYGKHKSIGILGVNDQDGDEAGKLWALDTYVTTIFHELIHYAGVGGHDKFARAAFNSLSDEEKKANPLFTKKDKLKGEDMDDANSRYFSNMINKYCRAPERGAK